MHYKNGREAKAGDKVINLSLGIAGVLHSVNAQSTSCNGRLATATSNDPWVNISDCLHVDDINAAAAVIPDLTKPISDPPPVGPVDSGTTDAPAPATT